MFDWGKQPVAGEFLAHELYYIADVLLVEVGMADQLCRIELNEAQKIRFKTLFTPSHYGVIQFQK